mmetsp:Transcript_41218/g.80567  ORF Transcript_41218/g.80567 Transcript_41218/m.80567 type:complete len:497 (+) Transcript_41218:44-1534(+)
MATIPLYFAGEDRVSQAAETIDVLNPATQELLLRVPCTTASEMEAIIANATEAQKLWREVPVQQRVRVLMKFHALVNDNKDDIAWAIVRENGKTKPDADGDVFRGVEVIEHAMAMPSHMMGEALEQISRNMDTVTMKQPLGVVAGIAPFNFPAMIPLWMMPVAVATGNAFVLKPSERVPTASLMLARLATKAGLPPGIFNILHGGKDAVNFLCDHPAVRAVSFVGSGAIGKHVYERSTANGKRCQCNMGAKNHAVVLPDADRDNALSGIIGAAFGAAGQRCMAISVCVFVGQAREWLPELEKRVRALRLGNGVDKETDIGPMITQQALQRALGIINSSVEAGAVALVDGRGASVAGCEKGNFLGATLLTGVTTSMSCYKEEIFGPCLCVMEVPTLGEAIELVNSNSMGNGVALFTRSGGAARKFQHEIEVGQIGINVPVPVPLPFFCWSSSKGSILGDHHFYGKSSIAFFTQIKTVVSRWDYAESTDGSTLNFTGR